jgi:hypothetical protein
LKKEVRDTQVLVGFLIWKVPQLVQQYEMVSINYTHPSLTCDIFDDMISYLWPWVRKDFPFDAIFILIRFLIWEEECLLGIDGFFPLLFIPRDA